MTDVANKPEDTQFPTLPDGWADGRRAASAPPPPDQARESVLGRREKERRDVITALPIFLAGTLAVILLGYESLGLPALGVATGMSIRLFLLERKINSLRGGE